MEKWVVGTNVQVTTIHREKITGFVYAVDAATQFLVIEVANDSTRHSQGRGPLSGEFRFIQLSCIDSHKYIDEGTGACSSDDILPELDIQKLDQRYTEAVARVGVGSKKAQEVFDLLSKTMPCEWNETSIVVMGVVEVRTPYTPKDIRGSDKNLHERVRVILRHAAGKEQAKL